MAQYLCWIGAYNLLGSLLVLACLHEPTADLVLRKATYMVSKPYKHGEFGRLWMMWAGSVNLMFAVVMMCSSAWSPAAMKVVTICSILGYVAVLVPALFFRKDPKWGPGLYVGFVLWFLQIGWGLWAVLGAPNKW